MKKFVLQSVVFFLVLASSLVGILFLADGTTDPFYVRFTTPKQTSLILGSSRAAQGIQPALLKEALDIDVFNYAFSGAQSPYGPTYLKSVKRKLKPGSKEHDIFILAVNPWTISSRTEIPNDSVNFREIPLCLGNTKVVDLKPNPYYLFHNLSGEYYKILNIGGSRSIMLHDDGWLEVSVKMDSASVKKRIDNKIEMYKFDNLPFFQYSSYRMSYLKKTIDYLTERGTVYLVRLPVHPRMMILENQLMPDFNDEILHLAPRTSGYLDMTNLNGSLHYTDGNHLEKRSGKVVTQHIADWIAVRKADK